MGEDFGSNIGFSQFSGGLVKPFYDPSLGREPKNTINQQLAQLRYQDSMVPEYPDFDTKNISPYLQELADEDNKLALEELQKEYEKYPKTHFGRNAWKKSAETQKIVAKYQSKLNNYRVESENIAKFGKINPDTHELTPEQLNLYNAIQSGDKKAVQDVYKASGNTFGNYTAPKERNLVAELEKQLAGGGAKRTKSLGTVENPTSHRFETKYAYEPDVVKNNLSAIQIQRPEAFNKLYKQSVAQDPSRANLSPLEAVNAFVYPILTSEIKDNGLSPTGKGLNAYATASAGAGKITRTIEQELSNHSNTGKYSGSGAFWSLPKANATGDNFHLYTNAYNGEPFGKSYATVVNTKNNQQYAVLKNDSDKPIDIAHYTGANETLKETYDKEYKKALKLKADKNDTEFDKLYVENGDKIYLKVPTTSGKGESEIYKSTIPVITNVRRTASLTNPNSQEVEVTTKVGIGKNERTETERMSWRSFGDRIAQGKPKDERTAIVNSFAKNPLGSAHYNQKTMDEFIGGSGVQQNAPSTTTTPAKKPSGGAKPKTQQEVWDTYSPLKQNTILLKFNGDKTKAIQSIKVQ